MTFDPEAFCSVQLRGPLPRWVPTRIKPAPARPSGPVGVFEQ